MDRSASPEEIRERLAALAEMLIATLALPADTKTVIVCPDGLLAQLPWPALTDEMGLKATLLPSAGLLLQLRGQESSLGRGKLALGDPDYSGGEDSAAGRAYGRGGVLAPLRCSRTEVTSLAGGEDDITLLGGEATEGGLVAALSSGRKFRAVHLACHGILNAERPGFSALAVTPSDADDGWLTALEIYTLEIRADLVVLSACRGAGDRARGGEGISGLMRAFLLAGAPRVVASLGKVDDASGLAFMTAFYREWERPGVPVVDALGLAMKGRRTASAHPADYASWVLWGLPD